MKTETLDEIANAGKTLQHFCHSLAAAAGWWTNIRTGQDLRVPNEDGSLRFNVPEKLCLIHSEISEGMEGHRKNRMDDKLPHRKMLEVELADAVIRAFDLAGAMGFSLGAAIAEKLEYNTQREDHKLEVRRSAADGKAY